MFTSMLLADCYTPTLTGSPTENHPAFILSDIEPLSDRPQSFFANHLSANDPWPLINPYLVRISNTFQNHIGTCVSCWLHRLSYLVR